MEKRGAEHGMILAGTGAPRKWGSRGFALMDVALSICILGILSLLMLKLALNVLTPRQWTMQQTLSDAYLTYEKAYAQRVPFDVLTSASSPWGLLPAKESSVVEIGRMPGNIVLTGTVHRTRIPDPGNSGTEGVDATANPAAMQIWKLQSILEYEIGGRRYVKSRTVVRSQ